MNLSRNTFIRQEQGLPTGRSRTSHWGWVEEEFEQTVAYLALPRTSDDPLISVRYSPATYDWCAPATMDMAGARP